MRCGTANDAFNAPQTPDLNNKLNGLSGFGRVDTDNAQVCVASSHQHRRPQLQHRAAVASEHYLRAGSVESQNVRQRPEEGDGRQRLLLGVGRLFLLPRQM